MDYHVIEPFLYVCYAAFFTAEKESEKKKCIKEGDKKKKRKMSLGQKNYIENGNVLPFTNIRK